MTTESTVKANALTTKYNGLAALVRELTPEDYSSYPVSQRGRVSEDNDLKAAIRDLEQGASFEIPGVFSSTDKKVNGGLQLYVTNYAKKIGERVKTKRNENGTDLAVYKLTDAEIEKLEADAKAKETMEAAIALAGLDVGDGNSEDGDSTEESTEEDNN